MSTRTVSTTALTVAGVAAVAGVVAYAVYFDHKRRTDVDFRKKLRACWRLVLRPLAHVAHPPRAGKEKKKAEKTRAADLSASESAQGSSASVSADDLRTALAKIRAEELPESPEEKEGYFMMHVGLGEQLLTQGSRLPSRVISAV
jgi:import receptor subunit TOM20